MSRIHVGNMPLSQLEARLKTDFESISFTSGTYEPITYQISCRNPDSLGNQDVVFQIHCCAAQVYHDGTIDQKAHTVTYWRRYLDLDDLLDHHPLNLERFEINHREMQ